MTEPIFGSTKRRSRTLAVLTYGSVDQSGDIACAVVTEEGAWGSVSFTDHFTLAQFDGEWKILNKTFTHTGGAPPAE